jgi:hypothetical protein
MACLSAAAAAAAAGAGHNVVAFAGPAVEATESGRGESDTAFADAGRVADDVGVFAVAAEVASAFRGHLTESGEMACAKGTTVEETRDAGEA